MDISPLLDKYPQLEENCRTLISALYRDLLGCDPVAEIHDYILQIGVRNNSTRSELMADFQILFNEKTEQLVKWLFEVLAPTIRFEAQKLERELKPKGAKSNTPSADDLVEAFEDGDDDFESHKKFKRNKEFANNSGRFGDQKQGNNKYGNKK